MSDLETTGSTTGNPKWFVCVLNKYILNYKSVHSTYTLNYWSVHSASTH